MAKRALVRDLRKLPKTLDGVAVSIGRTIRLGDGVELHPGDAVPKELLESPNLRALVRNGYVVPSSPVDHRFLGGAAKTKAKASPPTEPTALEAAGDVGAHSTKSELRAALETLGYDVPSGATKSELLELLIHAK